MPGFFLMPGEPGVPGRLGDWISATFFMVRNALIVFSMPLKSAIAVVFLLICG